MEFRFLVTVDTDTLDQARQALTERLDYDEEYGFNYTIEFNPVPIGGGEMLIRATHHYGFRYGHPHPWGIVQGIVWRNDRPCYKVWFPQGNVQDYWPVYDPSDPYEFEEIK